MSLSRRLNWTLTRLKPRSSLLTAINWGRYAEIFGFDDNSDTVFLGATPGNPELSEDELNTSFHT